MAKNQHKRDLINLAESYDKILNEFSATAEQVSGTEEASQTADVADHELIKWAMASTANYDRDYGAHALILSGRKNPPTLKPEARDALIAIYNKAPSEGEEDDSWMKSHLTDKVPNVDQNGGEDDSWMKSHLTTKVPNVQ